jgi:hypothetical protein
VRTNGEAQGKRRAGGAAQPRGFHNKKNDLVGRFPHSSFGDRRGVDCASVAYCLRLSRENDFGGADQQHLSFGVVGWRNLWQQWVLKKNMMR